MTFWPTRCRAIVGFGETSGGEPCGKPVSLVIHSPSLAPFGLCVEHRKFYDREKCWTALRDSGSISYSEEGGGGGVEAALCP